MSSRLVIVDGIRTPFAKAGTDLAWAGADELGRIAVNALLTRTGLDPSLIDEVIFGCVAQPVDAANVARVISLRSGIPESVPALTVQRNCASGCEAITLAQEKMRAGRGSIFIVGGTESMSNIPLLFKPRTARKFGTLSRAKTAPQRLRSLTAFRPADFQPRIGLLLGLTDPVCGLNMGETAELLAREFSLSRSAQDAFALESNRRALAARNRLAAEICPVFTSKREPVLQHANGNGKSNGNGAALADKNLSGAFVSDNGPREHQTIEALARLQPVFDRRNGTVTAGNASQVTDGAVALLVMTEERANKLGFSPLGALTGYSYAGCDPARMGLGPLYAIVRAEVETGLRLEDANLIEINEAFAAQTLAVLKAAADPEFCSKNLHLPKALGVIDPEKLNVNGGAIALGHPVGATGARLALTALHELKRRNAKRALISLCVGGGQGAALWFERL